MGGQMIGTFVGLVIASTRGVADRWRSQYYNSNNDTWSNFSGKQANITYIDISKSGYDPELVTSVIGNKSWTHPYCINCGEYVDRAVAFGQDDRDKIVCKPCLLEALKVIG